MNENAPMDNREEFCANRIGIWSETTPSCPRLQELVHCRNCEKFQERAKLLFAMPPPADYLDEWADSLSTAQTDTAAQGESVFIFRVAQEWLALPTTAVKRVTRLSNIHGIPRKSDNILLGLVNIKGNLELCFSLKTLLGLEVPTGFTEQSDSLFGSRFVELEKDGYSWVFAVDEVLDIHRYDLAETTNIPLTVSNAATSYILSVFRFQGKMIGYLDSELIISFLKRRLS